MLNKSLQRSTLSPLKQKSRLSLIGLASVFTLTLGLGVESAMAVREEADLYVESGAMPSVRAQNPTAYVSLFGYITGAETGYPDGLTSALLVAVDWEAHNSLSRYHNTISSTGFTGTGSDTLLRDYWLDIPTAGHGNNHVRKVKVGDTISVEVSYKYYDTANSPVDSRCKIRRAVSEAELAQSFSKVVFDTLPDNWTMTGLDQCQTTAPSQEPSEEKTNTTPQEPKDKTSRK